MELGTWGEWVGALASIVSVAISMWALSTSTSAEKKSRELTEKMQQANADAQKAQHQQQLAQSSFEREKAEREGEYQEWLRQHQERLMNLEENRRLREEEREARAVAGRISAWWAISPAKKWGLMVANEGTGNGSLRCLKIEVRSKYDKWPVKMNLLPGGYFFVESEYVPGAGHTTKTGWERPVRVENVKEYEAILNSREYSVSSIEFDDLIGTQWRWTDTDGLSKRS